MPNERTGSAARWGPLFGSGAKVWAETWEGTHGWGVPAYEHVIARAAIGPGTRVLDCGCGAGHFTHLAAAAGADVAGIDAAAEMIEIATARAPAGEFVVGDFENLPWDDNTFDVVTGFSTFQFAEDKVRALTEAGRVARHAVAVVIPTRVAESGLTAVLSALVPLLSPEAQDSLQHSGINALSGPGKLDDALAAAGLGVHEDVDVECPSVFDGPDDAVRAFLGAGPVALAVGNAGEVAVADEIRQAVRPLAERDGTVTLANWFRVILAHPEPRLPTVDSTTQPTVTKRDVKHSPKHRKSDNHA